MDNTFKYQAGFRRWLASFIDGLLMWIVPAPGALLLFFLLNIIGISEDNAESLTVLIYFLSLIGFIILNNVVIAYLTNGQSIGKRLMRIRIIKVDGSELGFLLLFMRELILQLTLGFLGIFALIILVCTEKRQGIHDLMLGTVVVKSR